MSETLVWWILAGALVALELVSGSFYLLMLALGAAAGAIAAWLGAPLAAQIAVSALLGGGAVWWWHRRQMSDKTTQDVNPPADPNQLDVGAVVMVETWQADGQTHVHYRGSDWLAQRAPGAPASTGPHRIVAVASNHLVLSPLPPA